MKRAVVFLLSLLATLVIICHPTSVSANGIVETGNCGDKGSNVTYALYSDGLLEIKGKGKMMDYLLVHPDNTGLGEYSPDAFDKAKKVVIFDGVTSIGDYAFEFGNVSSVTIPDSVTRIGVSSFAHNYNLTSVKLPESLSVIENAAFYDCGLKKVVIPDSVETIGGSAFMWCFRMTSAIIGNGVKEIGSYAFESCYSLTSVVLGNSLKSIGSYAFSSCEELQYIRLPDGLKELGYGAFYDCQALTSMSIPKSLTTSIGVAVDEGLMHILYTGTWEQGLKIDIEDLAYDATIHYNATGKELSFSLTRFGDGSCWNSHNCNICGSGHAIMVNKYAIRLYGADRYKTAFLAADELKRELGQNSFQSIIVASGTNFADALSGSYLAAVKSAPILLVKDNRNVLADVKNYIYANLAPGGTVYLLGGVSAVPKSMETGLNDYTVKRLGGANRYETNLKILEEAGVGTKDVLICTGTGFADSLSASAVGEPILLVKDSLSESQKDFLQGTYGSKYIIGGTSAVSKKVENAVKAYGTTKRIGGATRYETSAMIAEEFFPYADMVVLAYAQNFPDGLSGGALAYSKSIPLLLTASGKESEAAQFAQGHNAKSGFVLGGTGLISDKAVNNILELPEERILVIK